MATATLSAEESQQRLNEASARYMRDEIGEEAYEAAQRQFAPDYRAGLLALGESLAPSSGAEGREAPASEVPGTAELVVILAAIFVALALILVHRDRTAREEHHQEAA